MAVAILSTTVQSVVDKLAVVRNCSLDRAFVATASWTRLRIGMRYMFQNITANLPAASMFRFGLIDQAGLRHFQAGGPGHFAGVQTRPSVAWTKSVSGGFTRLSASLESIVLVDAVEPDPQANFFAGVWACNDFYGGLFVEFNKLTPTSWEITHRGMLSGSGHLSHDMMLAAMEMDTMGGVTSLLSYSSTGSSTIPVDQTLNGTLLGVGVGWNRTSEPLWLTDVKVAVLE